MKPQSNIEMGGFSHIDIGKCFEIHPSQAVENHFVIRFLAKALRER
ncbi:hypothetical protein RMS29_014520 [Agrobacterium rosae]|uniref:Uncharacterized protein n=1 Tax=Agrobacterium rosae TaxID=1972867 RepID=A0ABU4VVD9_9HYPH|nr:hypothetical protein [Agrobacterium rosae]MCM2434456.1 hypothetical protein [Agrobacterium rosae]MDX8329276.1 hypothetical protein [Agrobacterium rosae]